MQEGQIKELDPFVINAVDLDVPQDCLIFTIAQKPLHGILISGAYGNDIMHYKQRTSNHHNHGYPVHDFSMELLKNGKFSFTFTVVLLLL